MRRSLTATVSFATLLAFSSASVGCGSFARPPTYPHEDPKFKRVEVIPSGVDTDPPAALELLPGDIISVRAVSNETTSYDGLTIDSEGKVHVPGVGGIQVAGLPPHQAERTIEGMLQKQDRFVRVNVLVSAWSGHHATVIGAVTSEGAKIVTPGMRVADLLTAAGGEIRATSTQGTATTVMTDLDGARLVRGGKEVPISLRLALSGDPRHNVLVRAGDQLFVPAGLGNRIALLGLGSVGNNLQAYHHGMRLTEALAAGGLTVDSDMADIRVIRGPLKEPLVYQWSFKAYTRGKGGDVELAPGDVVYVARHWSANMGLVIGRLTPLLSLAVSGISTWALIDLQRQRAETPASSTPADTGNGN
jgi:polysaccharide biosynthesis/export protein